MHKGLGDILASILPKTPERIGSGKREQGRGFFMHLQCGGGGFSGKSTRNGSLDGRSGEITGVEGQLGGGGRVGFWEERRVAVVVVVELGGCGRSACGGGGGHCMHVLEAEMVEVFGFSGGCYFGLSGFGGGFCLFLFCPFWE